MPIGAYALVALFLACSVLAGIVAVRLVARAGGPSTRWAYPLPILGAFLALYLIGHRLGVVRGAGDRAVRVPGGAARRRRDRVRGGPGGGRHPGRRAAGAARSERASALVAARLVAGRDRHPGARPVRVGARVEQGIRQARDPHRQRGVAGVDPRSALGDGLARQVVEPARGAPEGPGSGRPARGSPPSGATGRPGCGRRRGRRARCRRGSAPARGRRGPRRPRRARRRASASRSMTRDHAGRSVRSPAGLGLTTSPVTGPPLASHAENPPSSTRTAAWPRSSSIHHRRAATIPPLSSYATTSVPSPMPSSRIRRANDAGSGRGWRPGPSGPTTSRSTSTNTAPGMWAASYSRRPRPGSTSHQRRSQMRIDGSSSRASSSSGEISGEVGLMPSSLGCRVASSGGSCYDPARRRDGAPRPARPASSLRRSSVGRAGDC